MSECEYVGAPIMEGFTGRKCKVNESSCWNYAKPDAVEKCYIRGRKRHEEGKEPEVK